MAREKGSLTAKSLYNSKQNVSNRLRSHPKNYIGLLLCLLGLLYLL